MTNTDTHILCEPYEIEDYLNKNEIRVDTFVQKTIDLLQSTVNSNYQNLDLFENLDSKTIDSMMSIKIPEEVSIKKLNKIFVYSNENELYSLINKLKENTNKIFKLTNNTDIETVKLYVEEFTEFLNEIKDNYTSDKIFTDFTSLSKFENVKKICDDSFFIPLKEWITSFPSSLLDVQLDTVSVNELISTQKSYTVQESNSEEDEESILLKRQILYLIFVLYNTLVNNIIETKVFWNSFLELIESENSSIDDFTMNTDEDEMNLIINELNESINDSDTDMDDDNEFSLESFEDPLFGFEDNPMSTKTRHKGPNPFKAVAKFFKTFPRKVNKIRKQFKLYRIRSKNHAFYMKYMGRIEGLYERYADEAPIVENTMKGDPVMILKESGHEYISEISNAFVDIQHGIIEMTKKFASSGNPKEMLTLIKSFGGMYMNDVQKASNIPENFITSLRFKIGEIILKGNKIYGYTAESIAENGKFPPSNHAIVSLFVDRPDEKPTNQRVSDIFKSPDSFKLIASNEKEPVFEVSMICSDLLTKGIQEESYKQLKGYRKESTEKFKTMLSEIVEKEADENGKKKNKIKKELTKQFNGCWRAVLKGYTYLVKQKNYIADLIQSYFIMMTRIDNLCKIAVTSLLHVETDHKDESYKTGFKADKLDSHKKYQQNDADEEGRQTSGEKQRAKMQAKAEKDAIYREKKESMNNHINAIKKSMSFF